MWCKREHLCLGHYPISTLKKNHDYYLLFKYWLFMAFESSHEPRGGKTAFAHVKLCPRPS